MGVGPCIWRLADGGGLPGRRRLAGDCGLLGRGVGDPGVLLVGPELVSLCRPDLPASPLWGLVWPPRYRSGSA